MNVSAGAVDKEVDHIERKCVPASSQVASEQILHPVDKARLASVILEFALLNTWMIKLGPVQLFNGGLYNFVKDSSTVNASIAFEDNVREDMCRLPPVPKN